jgi:hypothetical protein
MVCLDFRKLNHTLIREHLTFRKATNVITKLVLSHGQSPEDIISG